MIYFPPVLSSEQADQYGKSEGLERWKSPGGIPLGWVRWCPTQPAEGRALVLHGNAGAAAFCGHYAESIQQVAPLDVFLLEYPGYADRPGKPTERTLDESAAEAFQLLATNGPAYLVGESLGTGVAAYLAGRYPDEVAGLILFAPYHRLVAVAQAHMRIFPVGLMMLDRFPAEDNLRNYHGPLAVLIGGSGDTVIPPRFGRRLYDGYRGPKRLWEFPQCDHGTLMEQPPEVWKQLIEFCVAGGKSP
jgi:pimeloyl-ACP methyl ester carboxylesterase